MSNQCAMPNKKEMEERQKTEEAQLTQRMSQIKHKILVMSGKGGVGKSTVSTNLSFALYQAGKKVGLLDVDLHGPSIPTMLSLENEHVQGTDSTLFPVSIYENFKVISMGFLLPKGDEAVIMRGPLKYHTIRQLLKDVEWGELDCLIVDSPPGTGDEPLTVAQSINDLDGAIIVTTPQQVAITDVKKSVNFCRRINLPVIGIIENMSGFICPKCGEKVNIFASNGGKRMAAEMGVPFLGQIPIEPQVTVCCDTGRPYIQAFPDSETSKAFRQAIEPLLKLS